MSRTKKPKIGDIYELKIPKGLAYFQYTHEAEDGTQLIRVFSETHSRRPDNIAAISQQKELYFIFLVLAHALRKNEVELVSNQPVPDWAKPFPTMRKPTARTQEGKIIGWHIGHGLRLYTVGEMQQALYVRELTPEQEKLSIAQIWPMSTLAERIERGWLPERNNAFEEKGRQKAAERRAQAEGIEQEQAKFLDHYFYFPKRRNAELVADPLRNKGWAVDIRMGADENWLVLAKQPAPITDDIEEIRDELERLAEKFHGEYDGWGAAI